MHEHDHKKVDSRTLWIAVLISAGAALLISLAVSIAFQIPAFLASRPRPAPDISGLTVEEAEQVLTSKKLTIIPLASEPSDAEEGTIVDQDPEPGSQIRGGGVIKVTLSSGRPMVTIPNLAGFSLVRATEQLQASGLFVSDVVSKNDTLPEDAVIGTEPEAGVSREKGTKITLYVSLGPDLIEVPKVTGRKLPTARKLLSDNGFRPGEEKYQVTTEYYQGTVMKQVPKAGELAPLGSSVDLIVAGVLR